ncbi:hypothetical protein JF544_03100 [Halobacillus kuroshimensis]|uniref:Uncharacterized protein n=1 Tax=Halobacillus kuroshimensis TaxID=302481 RepID=A0ABS3DSA4_9BACI|nr:MULTISPECIES: hypothetical protein [Halobacillus]MBN8234214.1 hypothetical protein [Halobacillus kuroshimensis]
MYANQRISGPYYPSHSTQHPPHNQYNNEQINHWCEELDQCSHQQTQQADALHQRSSITKLSPPTFMN